MLKSQSKVKITLNIKIKGDKLGKTSENGMRVLIELNGLWDEF